MGSHQVGTSPTARTGQVLVPGGLDLAGSDRFYPEERPVVEVAVSDVWWDPHPVTNAQFAAFVADTGHVTVAERDLDPADFPGADPALLVPGSQVFTQAAGPVPLHDWTRWWRWARAPASKSKACWWRWPVPGPRCWTASCSGISASSPSR